MAKRITQPDPRTVYLETMGCQMNKLDSELVLSQLTQMGYRLTEDPDAAGVVIYNTCSVRQHAEDKVISKIGQIKHEKAAGLAGLLPGVKQRRPAAATFDFPEF